MAKLLKFIIDSSFLIIEGVLFLKYQYYLSILSYCYPGRTNDSCINLCVTYP
jgi:hypothetical protein